MTEPRIAWNTVVICLAFCARDFALAMAESASFALRGSVRAKPLAKPVRYRSLTPEIEIELVRAYREDGDLDALEWLVGAHRPMVVTMAKNRWWGGNGTSLKALVEYGMFGLRFAAEPLRPSLTKKGAMVGFDPAAGHRFSTYARHYAEKELKAALADDPKPEPERNPELEAAVDPLKASWHKAWSFAGLHDAPAFRLLTSITLAEKAGRVVVCETSAYRKPYRPWTLWSCTEARRRQINDVRRLVGLEDIPRWDWGYRPCRLRNYLLHPITATERANRHAFDLRSHLVLGTFDPLAKDVMEGWDDVGDSDFLAASSHGSRHILKGKDYCVPRE
jgi:hypothetical protein